MKKPEGGKVVTRRSRVEHSQDRAGRCSPTCYIASRVRPPQSARRVASLVLFFNGRTELCIRCCPVPSRAVPCRPVLLDADLCIPIRMYMLMYIGMCRCRLVTSRAGRGRLARKCLLRTINVHRRAHRRRRISAVINRASQKFCLRRKAAGFHKPPAAGFRPA